MGLELGPESIVATAEDVRFALDLTGLDAGEALALLLTHCRGYELRNVQGMLNIGPRGSFEQFYLNVRAKTFALKGVPLCDALAEVKRVLNPAFTPPRESASVRMMQQRERPGRPPVPAGDELPKPVTVDLHGATVKGHPQCARGQPRVGGVGDRGAKREAEPRLSDTQCLPDGTVRAGPPSDGQK